MQPLDALLIEGHAFLGDVGGTSGDTAEQKAGAAARAMKPGQRKPGMQPGQMPKGGRPGQAPQMPFQPPGGGKGASSPLQGQGGSGMPGSPAQAAPAAPGMPADAPWNAPTNPMSSLMAASPAVLSSIGAFADQQPTNPTNPSMGQSGSIEQSGSGGEDSLMSMLGLLKSGSSLGKTLYDLIPSNKEGSSPDYSKQSAGSEEPVTSSSLTSPMNDTTIVDQLGKQLDEKMAQPGFQANPYTVPDVESPEAFGTFAERQAAGTTPADSLKSGYDLAKSPGATTSLLSENQSSQIMDDANRFLSTGATPAVSQGITNAGTEVASSGGPNLGLGAGAADEAVGSLAENSSSILGPLGALAGAAYAGSQGKQGIAPALSGTALGIGQYLAPEALGAGTMVLASMPYLMVSLARMLDPDVGAQTNARNKAETQSLYAQNPSIEQNIVNNPLDPSVWQATQLGGAGQGSNQSAIDAMDQGSRDMMMKALYAAGLPEGAAPSYVPYWFNARNYAGSDQATQDFGGSAS